MSAPSLQPRSWAEPPEPPAPLRVPSKARVCIVEGEIAAGKTALTMALAATLRARGFRVCLILEPVDRWREVGILQKFYADRRRHGYGFQTFVFATRVLEIVEAVRADPEADIYLLERSPATDLIFMYAQSSEVDPVEMKMYAVWCDAYRLMLPIDLARAKVLYLQTSLDHCMKRLASRAREEEYHPGEPGADAPVGGVSLEYQQYLRALHEAFFLGSHPGEFPGLPPSPFPREAVVTVGPELADLDFRLGDEGGLDDPAKKRVVSEILTLLGFSMAAHLADAAISPLGQ